jgi:hypothetical protein
MTIPTLSRDPELKARHRAVWASGDYPAMVEAWLLPLGHRIVQASGIQPGQTVLDVAAGTGNASLQAAARGPPSWSSTGSRATPRTSRSPTSPSTS